MRTLAWRLVAGGLLVALAVAASGGAIERARFGSTDDEALARVEAELRRQFDTSARALGDLAAAVRADSTVIRAALRDRTEASRLFDVVSSALAQQQAGPTGVTVYDASNRPLAWAGRVSDLAKQLVSGPPALVMVPGALGPRLVRVEPIEDTGHHDVARDATIVVEQSMANLQQAPGLADTAVLATSLVPATIRTPVMARGTAAARPPATGNYAFAIRAPGGGVLVDVEVTRADLAAARADWRSRTTAASLLALVAALLLCTGPALDLRRQARSNARFLIATAIVAAILLAARFILLSAVTSVAGQQPFDAPANLLLSALTAAGLVRLGIDALERRRMVGPRLPPPNERRRGRIGRSPPRRPVRGRGHPRGRDSRGLPAFPRTRGRAHRPRRAALLVAPAGRIENRHRFRARVAARGGHLGDRHARAGHPHLLADAARASSSRGGGAELDGRRRSRGRPHPPAGPVAAARTAGRGHRGVGRLRRGPDGPSPPGARGITDAAAGGRVCRVRHSSDRDVPRAPVVRHRLEGAADRDALRATGREPAERGSARIERGARSDRRDADARRLRPQHAGDDHRQRAGRLEQHVTGHVPTDVGHRAVRRRRRARQPVRAESPGVHDASL